ncbi:MAG: 4-hydroxy-3-methylbut-2-enyl diphosphate reductase [Clostridia bacterium]|nr:4-hydroxy-3-methylbut-2-enyl diphosphate reductase [Clostridia bacterium]
MEIIVGKTAGFCYGVKNAVDNASIELEKNGKICCLGEIVHNSNVVESLKSKGLIIIDDLSQNEDNLKTVIRAHGVSKKVYDNAKNQGIELVDLTCPNVLKIHKIVSEHVQKGFFVFVIGNKNHPETIGTIGFCNDNYAVIENEDDINKSIDVINELGVKDLLIVVQTTFSVEKFEKYTNSIRDMAESNNVNVVIINTICNATKIRQDETDKISKQVDYMIIIGGKNSSNTKKLYEIALKNCEKTICVEDAEEINIGSIKSCKRVGIMAGASTPQSSIDEVIELLKNT